MTKIISVKLLNCHSTVRRVIIQDMDLSHGMSSHPEAHDLLRSIATGISMSLHVHMWYNDYLLDIILR